MITIIQLLCRFYSFGLLLKLISCSIELLYEKLFLKCFNIYYDDYLNRDVKEEKS
jgi:hypothetical protein